MPRSLCLFPLLATLLAAQEPARRLPVPGIVSPVPDAAERFMVEAADPGGRAVSARASVQHDGSFEFSALDSGTYEFRLTSPAGAVVARTFGSVPAGREVRFELPAAPAPPAPVSLYRLSHRVPAKALKAMRQAVKSLDHADTEKTIRHLETAIAADPEFADALHLRGILALRDKDYPRAHHCLVRAAALDGANPRILANAAVIRFIAREPEEAARLARAALRLDPRLETARIVLGKLQAGSTTPPPSR